MGHIPVLLQKVIDLMNLRPGSTIVDATFGGGGHSAEILNWIMPGGKLVAFDKDEAAEERVDEMAKKFGENFLFINEDFRHMTTMLKERNIHKIDGALFDLGMSSFHIDDPNRGFSFLTDGPLDMRFDKRHTLSTKDIINRYSKADIADIIRNYGEERYANIIAGRICDARRKKQITTTAELADIIKNAVGWKYRGQKIHPAARSFQALRIFVNDELTAAEEGINAAMNMMNSGARICVISFHSLEDRIVKNIFRGRAKDGGFKLITKKPLVPDDDEIKMNSRARSAKLRVAERV
ncbi:MAG TPA: 16S rRNA (cytosine(1402)-N(4))-methyltransferase RsmH [Candidatus Omnitrophota bacterium]|nr:16S rRNA (cytosine(1402)-N(4))-methyltransferase RsmH [Candidatus Omnitrophota bacterium]HPS20028.1 16S rRNA (cytosine(1402)-N(4))-methyltransferase RsmH [Candidatus Omnitrophota bacterium]